MSQMSREILWMTIKRHPDSLKSLVRERLRQTGWKIHEHQYDSISALEDISLEDIDGVILTPARYIPPQFLKRMTKCSLIQIWSSGYDKFNLHDAREAGLRVANNLGSNAVAVAEHTILLMLGSARRSTEMHRRVVQGSWAGNDHGMSSHSLYGKTLGIVGMGRIGSLVAARALSFGMKIVFVDPKLGEADGPTGTIRTDLESLLRMSDFISLHLHLTNETRNIINRESFSLMERQPFLVNTARAELVERDSLLEALENGAIRGLAIDAHYSEPTLSDDPMWKFPSVLGSPHIAGSTVDSYIETIEVCVKNLHDSFAGKTPRSLI